MSTAFSSIEGEILEPVEPDDDLLKPVQVASTLRVSVDQLGRWRSRGEGPSYYALSSGVIRYPRRAFEQWLRSRQRAIGSAPRRKQSGTALAANSLADSERELERRWEYWKGLGFPSGGPAEQRLIETGQRLVDWNLQQPRKAEPSEERMNNGA